MNIEKIIDEWISASNSYDTERYLDFYNKNAVLNDPSVGKEFVGKKGIKDYFESYFIGYETQTKKVRLIIKDEYHAHLEVKFTGVFSEGQLGGIFDFTFKGDKIEQVNADLIL